jgi:glycosyltransferase involved in cell wall biosynthesis
MMRVKEINSPVQLSIIVISSFSYSLLENCLESILANEKQDEIEIIVVDCCLDKPVSCLFEKHSNIQILQFPHETSIPIRSAAGISQSKGEIIALTDSSCIVDSNWISSILNAHQSSSLIIGGAVEIFRQMKVLDLAIYFCEYGQFMRPLKSGEAAVLPGNNISFKRSALAIANEYTKEEFWKTLWCQKLKAAGVELISEPSILVYYAKEFKLVPLLARRFRHGRCFAGMRAKEMTVFKQRLFLIGSIFLPFVFIYRTIYVILSKRRLLKELLLSFPFIVLAIIFWSFGEMSGYLSGAGKSCDQMH